MRYAKRLRRRLRFTSAALGIVLLAGADGLAQDEWQVAQAGLRFTVDVAAQPSHAEAGIFVELPDGGILPRPYPVTRVLDAEGRILESYALWWNGARSLAVLFETPRHGRGITIYVGAGRSLQTWTPESGLRPGTLLVSDARAGTMKAAENLARPGQVDADVRVWRYEGHPRAPLCIPGDLAGRPPPCSFYLLTHIVCPAAGEAWFAPFTHTGTTRVKIDGRELRPRERIAKWGGTGEYLELTAGLHRLEILAACPQGDTFAAGRGVMWMTWAPPGTTIDELGGPRPDNVPFAGTSKQASRVFRSEELVQSGTCHLRRVETRSGIPAAVFRARAADTFWFDDETPLIRYEFTAMQEGNPANSTFTWQPAEGAAVEGARLDWLLPGLRTHAMALRAAGPAGASQCAYPVYAYSAARTSLNRPATREAFRKAFLTMLQAWPESADPTAGWPDSMWRNLFRTLEIEEGEALLAHLFTKRWDLVQRRLDRDRRERLQDLFVVMGARIDPESTLRWIERFQEQAPPVRRDALQIDGAEILMYELNRIDAAAAALRPLERRESAAAPLARIRLGDAAFLTGDLNAAAGLYAAVQNTYRAPNPASPSDESDARGASGPRARGGIAAARRAGQTERLEAWKAVAVLDAAASETVKALIEQGYLEEALWELAAWERRFPLSKLSGDFVILEARVYMELEHYIRARRALEAYCAHVDASSYMPEAVRLVLRCMTLMNAPADEQRAFCETMKERLEFHPAVRQIDERLRELNEP